MTLFSVVFGCSTSFDRCVDVALRCFQLFSTVLRCSSSSCVVFHSSPLLLVFLHRFPLFSVVLCCVVVVLRRSTLFPVVPCCLTLFLKNNKFFKDLLLLASWSSFFTTRYNVGCNILARDVFLFLSAVFLLTSSWIFRLTWQSKHTAQSCNI